MARSPTGYGRTILPGGDAPQEKGYERTVAPGGAARLTASASPAQFGAGVGAQIEQIGNVLERQQEKARALEEQRQEEADYSAAATSLAEYKLSRRQRALELQESPPPAGKDYAKTWREDDDAAQEQFLQSLPPNPRVRQRILPHLAEDAGTLQLAADGFEAGLRAKQHVNNIDTQDGLYSHIATLPATTADEVDVNIGAVTESIYSGVGTDEAKFAKANESARKQIISHIESRPPEERLALLDSGRWGPIIADKQQAIRDGANAEIQRDLNQRQAGLTKEIAAFKDGARATIAQVSDGIHVDPAAFGPLITRAQQLPDPDQTLVADLQRARQAALVNHHVVTPAQATLEINKIKSKKGWENSPDDVYAVNALDARRTKLREAEPEVAPPDWSNMASVQTYESAIVVDAKTRGIPHPAFIVGEVAEQLKPLMSTVDGQRQAVHSLSQMKNDLNKYTAARELAPQDTVFQIAATLSDPDSRNLALAGRATEPGKKGPAADASLRDQMYKPLELIRLAMGGVDADIMGATQDTAVAIAAGMMLRQVTTEYTDAIGEEAVTRALDGRTRGTKKGGVHHTRRGDAFVLPTSQTAEEFDLRYYRKRDDSQAFLDGRPISWTELRSEFRLVAIRDGIYQWVDANGDVVTNKAGERLLWDANKAVQEVAGAEDKRVNEVLLQSGYGFNP